MLANISYNIREN